VKGLPASAELRKRLYAVTSLGEVEGIFAEYLTSRDRYLSEAGEPEESEEAPLEAAEV
jgi:hypothetical protein